MAELSPYKLTLRELERGVHVPREQQVESVEVDLDTAPDPRGREPDRGWFAAGG